MIHSSRPWSWLCCCLCARPEVASHSSVLSSQLNVLNGTPSCSLHAWIADHLGDDLSVPVMAARTSMSVRNFAQPTNTRLKKRTAMRIVIPLFDQFTALDAVGPYQVLSEIPGAEVVFAAAQRGPVRSDTGTLAIVADASLQEVDNCEVLVVPGGTGTRRGSTDET